MDSIIAKPYGLGQKQKDLDFLETQDLERELFPPLCNLLNQHHGTNHQLRFWRIILGHWFQRYINVIFNRVKTLEQCETLYNISGTSIFDIDNYNLAPLDSYDAIFAFNDDVWNNKLYGRILSISKNSSYPKEKISINAGNGFKLNLPAKKATTKEKIINWGFCKLDFLTKFLFRAKDALIISSYLPFKEVIKLHLSLMQVPQFFYPERIKKIRNPNQKLRSSLSKRLSLKVKNNTYDNIFCELVFELLPVCYLEGFTDLLNSVHNLRWPRNPKFIFTSNNFDTDEVFKLWTALKVETGTKYITGQHGNNYGTFRYMNPSIEELTSDRFLTWGWTDNLPQHTPAFIFKKYKKDNRKLFNPSGGLLFIGDPLLHRMEFWDTAFEFEESFKEHKKFIERLEGKIRNNLTIRVHPTDRFLRSFASSRWNDYDSYLNIDDGICAVNSLISKSRLVIHGYDSTGILETLSQNIPTLAFWNNNLEHLRDSALPHYQLLIDAGIVHLNSDSVVLKVNEVWDDINQWWESKEIQDARNTFCERYARESQDRIQDIKKVLIK
jgi:putative transferase (TIGR04331 family)